ncbi:MAG TPA: hypothetical protein VF666_21885 [Pyrinomonadaceae bacterium]|jgi:hypothetical protein
MFETQHFVNRGDGWTCKRCSEDPTARVPEPGTRARFFTEGEAEQTEPALSSNALARWHDATHQTLICPRCGILEGMSRKD